MNYELTIMELAFFLINIAFFFLSSKLFNYFYREDDKKAKIRIKSSLLLSGTLVIFQIIHFINGAEIFKLNEYFYSIFEKSFYSILTIYIMLIIQSSIHFMVKNSVGEQEIVDNESVMVETPSSRMWTLLSVIIIIFATIYINIQIWSAASMMETTGIVGLTLGALALTNSVWFPDIYQGIVSLKIKSFVVGDTIILNEEKDAYIVFKTSFFHVLLLNINDNNRTTILNNNISKSKIHNLTKIASSQGIRRTIIYKIGYPKHIMEKDIDDKITEMMKIETERMNKKDKENKKEIGDGKIENKPIKKINRMEIKEKIISDFILNVQKMTEDAYSHCIKQKNSKLKEKDFNISVLNAADHSIEFVLSYYIQKLPNTFSTEIAREYLIKTPLMVNEAMLLKSYKYGIDLSTPITHKQSILK